jgi:hypothetical protein
MHSDTKKCHAPQDIEKIYFRFEIKVIANAGEENFEIITRNLFESFEMNSTLLLIFFVITAPSILSASGFIKGVEPWSPNLVAGYHADSPTSSLFYSNLMKFNFVISLTTTELVAMHLNEAHPFG